MGGFLDLSGEPFGPAAGGKARRLVILLHGYGSNGDDLMGLAPHWVRQLRGTASPRTASRSSASRRER
jgi:phospholipase/carboxylesterase